MKKYAQETIANERPLRNQLIKACNQLISKYKAKIGTFYCPLCMVTADYNDLFVSKCNVCPWVAYKGKVCTDVIPLIGEVRRKPNKHSREVKNRIRTLKRWVKRMESIS